MNFVEYLEFILKFQGVYFDCSTLKSLHIFSLVEHTHTHIRKTFWAFHSTNQTANLHAYKCGHTCRGSGEIHICAFFVWECGRVWFQNQGLFSTLRTRMQDHIIIFSIKDSENFVSELFFSGPCWMTKARLKRKSPIVFVLFLYKLMAFCGCNGSNIGHVSVIQILLPLERLSILFSFAFFFVFLILF